MREAREPRIADAEASEQLAMGLRERVVGEVAQALVAHAGLGKHRGHAHARVHGLLGMLPHELHGADAKPGERIAVEQDLTCGGAQVACEHAAQRGFAKARRRLQRHALAGLNGEVKSLVDGGLAWIGEGNAACF